MIAAPRKERGERSSDFSKFHEAPKAVETAEKSLAEHPAPAPPEPPRRMNLNALSKRANEAIEIAASIAFANIEERPAFSEEEKMAFTCADDALCQAARKARRKINAKPGEAIAFLYRNIWFMSEPLEDDSDVIWIHPYGPDFNETIDDNGLPLQVTYWNA